MRNVSGINQSEVVADGSELEVVDVRAGEDGKQALPTGVEAG